jgi:MFS family permease
LPEHSGVEQAKAGARGLAFRAAPKGAGAAAWPDPKCGLPGERAGENERRRIRVEADRQLEKRLHIKEQVPPSLTAIRSSVFAIILQPIYGCISDHVGRRPVLIWFGACGAVFTYPLLTGIRSTKSAAAAFCLVCFAWIIVAAYTAVSNIVKAELFPTAIRATGVGVTFGVAVSIFGGTIPLIALQFKAMGHETWFYWYVTACMLVSLVVYALMRDTKFQSAMDSHQ